MNELEKLLANLLQPKADPSNANQNVERLEQIEEFMTISDSITATTSTPEKRVGFAIVGYSETA